MTMQARVPTLPRTAGPGPGARAEEDEADVPGRHLLGRPVWLIAVLAALLRVPYLHAPMSPDEGGFLIVAHHWHSGGGSLYGPYWVDRPPLLIALFRVADLLGGLTALRVIGCLAVGVAVLGVGLAAAAAAPATRVARRASVWASAVAAALLVAPTGGAVMVNGELLATPFIAFGVAFTIRAVRDHQGWIGPRVSAVLAGACAVAAAMVKQNMIDVVVFGAVLGLVAALRHVITVPALLRRVGLAVAGGVAAFAVVLVGAAMRGTTPGALYFAMYPFRLRAAQVMAQNPSDARSQQFSNMVGQWVVTGAPIIIVAFLAVLLLRGPGRGRFALPLAVATLVLTVYDAVSIGAGGSYWSHYILQLVVPTALMTGMLLGTVPRI
ncbi:MAG: hypothetical protein JOZ82_10380, partial [Marmoricola sp.]|nr:hypothetical protein [Marmoricola sp.]